MRFAVWLVWLSFMVCGMARAGNAEDIFVAARDAYKARNEQVLSLYSQQLQAENYVLAPYVEYWRLLLRLEQADPAEVQEFLTRYADLPFSDRVRAEWLKQLGKRQNWTTFFNEVPKLVQPDVGVACYALMGRDAQGETSALQEGKAIWLEVTEPPANCDALFERMFSSNLLNANDIWARVRLSLAKDRISIAKGALHYLPDSDVGNLKLLDRAYENPQRMLERNLPSIKTRYGRELVLYALERVSRTRSQLAQDLWHKLQAHFSPEDQAYLWGRLALYAAQRHDPIAREWFRLADDRQFSPEQFAWKIRSALRVHDWDMVLASVAAMPPAMRGEGVWRYWNARALKEKGAIAAANPQFLALARERTTYYGLLAEEELGETIGSPSATYKATDENVRAIQNIPGIQRSLELDRQDMHWESRSEWLWATRSFDDMQLIAAAELAFRQEWYDIAIITAEKTSVTHDFALRYPTPFHDVMQVYARNNGLDEAWVYGLIRQESRFVGRARSGAGASGMMQVMPATAKWIAKRIGLSDYHPGMINRLDTNLQLGTYYLRYVLDQMGGQPLMATAAYNAGPGRAKRWGDGQTQEGAIYVETIPFSETRGYVQKVMSNAYFYAHQLGGRLQTLKQRLGEVAAGTGVLTPQDTEQQ
jgi:soluble lytic murein transglycosylase